MPKLLQRILDPSLPPLIVAEISGNHSQDFETAKRIIKAAANAGADAVKLQTYTADCITLDSDRPEFLVHGGLWNGRRLHELYQQASTPYEWHGPLRTFASQCGIPLFSTPFDEAAVDFLEDALQPELYKVASFELTHIPLLKRVGQTGKPVILSTGMATVDEIEEAINALRSSGSGEIVLLKCVSAYPSEPEGFNLLSMPALRTRFGTAVGLSDHTMSSVVAIASVALGARVIEKHLTDDRTAGGIDAGFSLERHEFAQLVDQCRRAHAALGSAEIGASPQDAKQQHFRRSIYASKDIAVGERFTTDNLRIVRPSLGLAPKHWESLLGQTATRRIPAGSPLREDDLPRAAPSDQDQSARAPSR